MSVAASQRKRFFEAEENEDRLQRLGELKRAKAAGVGGSPSGRCAPGFGHAASYAVGQGTVVALRALFPEMNDKVIADVLAEYGDNIDAAIKHLTELRLSQAQAPAGPGDRQQAWQEQQQQQQQPQQRQLAQQHGGGGGEAAAAGSAPAVPARSAEEWVELVVREMSQARDMEDAKRRASSVLQAFEQAAGGDAGKLKEQVAELARENQLLKRAVAIQNSRMQDAAREGEVAQLRSALADYQARVHALEVQNYSLAMHLKAAADGGGRDAVAAAFKNPDVF
eukprot:scaffold4.g4612.t1